MTRQTGKEKVSVLIKNFESDKKEYKSTNFQEAEARKYFIDPFFIALGWEYNLDGVPKRFWDVHLEPRQRVNSTTKKPDYVFRIREGNKYFSKFFVEAKAPHVNLDTKKPVFQAKRYAFSSHGKTPIVILTDFETFRVFNGLEKPIYDNPNRGLLSDFEYNNYLDNWDNIWENFSKEAVIGGSIDKLIGKEVHNVKSLDDEFLSDISAWRVDLAKNVANSNKSLLVDDINEAVQRILDRLIFVRNLEDRGIETGDTLLEILKKNDNKYTDLLSFFRKLNNDYNGLLFKEHFSEKINVNESVIKDIVNNLYEPYSPYSFDIIEPEILGRIYERFLGSKIRLTKSHLAKVEEKPEVKKAGGVYYTPQYIVDYIVENTVGVKIKDKTPEEIAQIKICDPACGSGSFLLGAFQCLLEYHCEWYAKANQTTQKRYKDDFFLTAENEIQLSLKKKTEILKNNIFGVDIDREATEVAIMSLYLKLLDEGYDKGNIEMFMKGILPDMQSNIKCGNSLIGTDYYSQGELIQTEELKKVNCFDWAGNDGFADIFKNGGFDVVIGNPPWGADIDNYVQYFEKHYPNSTKNYKDSFKLFIEKGFYLIKNTGYFGFIVPSAFMLQPRYIDIRRFLRDNTTIHKLWNIGNGVFGNVNAPCGIFIVEKEKQTKKHKVNFLDTTLLKTNEQRIDAIRSPKYSKIKQEIYYITIEETFVSFYKELKHNEVLLENLLDFKDAGINYQRVKVGLSDKGNSDLSKRLLYEGKRENECDVEYWKGEDINSYFISSSTKRYVRINTVKSLRKNERVILNKDYFAITPKIIWRQTAPYPIAALDTKGIWFGRSIQAGTRKTRVNLDIRYILAIINSKYLRWLYEQNVKEEGRIFPQIKLAKIVKLPIPSLDLTLTLEKTKHDTIVSLVNKIIDFKQKETIEISDHQKSIINRQITAFEKEIDKIVYELYKLTADEINIVEG